ncbi:MAG: homocysteine S-methyltransferase family protein [Clostridia bacterium]|nr:homocysteine S-methyltransferase family protein [Clostridia bacterium]
MNEKIIVLDGATGTHLQALGMPTGICPEKWVLDNPDILIDLQKSYMESGSDIVYTCTFGANRIKLKQFGLDRQVIALNKELATISRKAVGKNALVAGDISSTGKYVQPFGQLDFEQAVDIFKEQVSGLLQGGVDLFIIETMIDIQEARAALIAVKETCQLPVWVTMTFDENGKTLTGTDCTAALITLQSLGADAFGCNCSTGPEPMVDLIKKIKPYSKVPLIAKPNAGMPKLINGNTEFDMDKVEFGKYSKQLVRAGANIIGGCCGSTPDFIREIKQYIKDIEPSPVQNLDTSVLSSYSKAVSISLTSPVKIIGERINPTGKKTMQQELVQGKLSKIKEFAIQQRAMGANILDVNVGMPGIDEKETMKRAISLLSTTVDTPLCIDSSDPSVIKAALRIYPGRALINSISLENKKIKQLLPIAAKYGAMFILLPVSDEGIPNTLKQRCQVIQKIYDHAKKYGFSKKDIIIDGLVMSVSSDANAARITLDTIDWSAHQFGCNTVIGLSNVSFGLPERKWLNSAFLAMAIERGLSTAIANPNNDLIMNIKIASDVLASNDPVGRRYIQRFVGSKTDSKTKQPESNKIEQKIYNAVIDGDRENIDELIHQAIKANIPAGKLLQQYLIPAIDKVGDLFEEKEYYLPQLILSAQTMKQAYSQLEKHLVAEQNTGQINKHKVLIATVKGDVHDIGKNIVALMLKSHGFEVIDLGKDVPSEKIIEQAKKKDVDIIGLSALMTTTMHEMENVIKLAKKERLKCKFMIGGAAVNQSFAQQIQADGYAEDANNAVKLAKKLLSNS